MRFQGQRCMACDWPRSGGYVSFGKELHEPHCLSCLSEWEKILRAATGAAALWITLDVFRDWQRERAQKMGVAA